jgi:endonuclease/exonuclease/phosphatase family metal-dependent hydrolase
MTFNIHHGKGTDGKVDLKRIAKVIKESDADIIGLNEVDKHFSKRSAYIDQAAWLAEDLQMNYVFGPAVSFPSKRKDVNAKWENTTRVREYGNALLSKHPILSQETHCLHSRNRLIEGRSVIEASIGLKNQLLNVFVTHLSLNPFLHRNQTDLIVNKVKKPSSQTIVLGDWNMKPKAKAWNRMTDSFIDSWGIQQPKKGYTFPSTRPRARLDYIFVSRDFSVINATVVTKVPGASDHLPLEATLML